MCITDGMGASKMPILCRKSDVNTAYAVFFILPGLWRGQNGGGGSSQ